MFSLNINWSRFVFFYVERYYREGPSAIAETNLHVHIFTLSHNIQFMMYANPIRNKYVSQVYGKAHTAAKLRNLWYAISISQYARICGLCDDMEQRQNNNQHQQRDTQTHPSEHSTQQLYLFTWIWMIYQKIRHTEAFLFLSLLRDKVNVTTKYNHDNNRA